MAEALPESQDWVVVARLGKTRGLRGELYGRSWNAPERLAQYKRVWLRRRDGSLAAGGDSFEFEQVRSYKDGLLLRFGGVDSINAAEPLEHCEVVVPPAERLPLADGEFYLSDLVGCEVFLSGSGRKVGEVAGWQEFGGPELLEVAPGTAGSSEIVWIPLVRSICVEIDLGARRIVVDPPEGLIELNEGGVAG